MERKDKNTILIIIIISTLFVAVTSASFAFFMSKVDSLKDSKATVKTTTLDSLVYSQGADLEIEANQDNFAQGKENLVKTTDSDVTLKVNNMTSAEYCYDVWLKIDSNTFEYTNGTTPEIKIATSKNNVSIFSGDITIQRSNLLIASKQKIYGEPSSTVVDKWQTTLTMINLDTLQNENEGKTFKGNLEFITVDC